MKLNLYLKRNGGLLQWGHGPIILSFFYSVFDIVIMFSNLSLKMYLNLSSRSCQTQLSLSCVMLSWACDNKFILAQSCFSLQFYITFFWLSSHLNLKSFSNFKVLLHYNIVLYKENRACLFRLVFSQDFIFRRDPERH